MTTKVPAIEVPDDAPDARTHGTTSGPLSNLSEDRDESDAGGQGFGSNIIAKPPYTMPTSRNAVEYNMSHPKRGVALIFNHRTFVPHLQMNERRGTDVDREKLEKTFHHLGFAKEDIHVYDDLPKDQLKRVIKKVAALDHTNHDCLVVSICTHGDEGFLYAYDRKLNTQEIWEPFAADKCPTLIGKPKIFFIQACQGDRTDPGAVVDHHDGNSHYKIPVFADFLLVYSTVPGFYSWRNTSLGSWFIQALCDNLLEHGHEVDLLSLLTLVNCKVGYDYTSCVPHDDRMDKKKQIPCVTSMLTRKVTFAPKKLT